MNVRSLKSSDIPALQSWAESSGFEYPQPNDASVEKVLVATDSEDRPIVAVAAKRLIEIFCWMNPDAGAELRSEALQIIHAQMAEALKRLGYDCAEAFIPPQLERRGFGRLLERRFGWKKNWTSWGKRL